MCLKRGISFKRERERETLPCLCHIVVMLNVILLCLCHIVHLILYNFSNKHVLNVCVTYMGVISTDAILAPKGIG